MATFLALQPPQSLLLNRRASLLTPQRPILCPSLRSSSLRASNSTVSVEAVPPTEEIATEAEPSVRGTERTRLGGCKTCGRDEVEKGCNGEGRIQGGIATVPGFGWWPIKAYRPCPGFVESGGRYRRQGQSMDEVAFGRGERETSLQSSDQGKTRKKRAQGD